MNFTGQDYLKKRIKQNQKFLLKLLHLHIGGYFPLRKYLGISYKGKIDEISHLSFAYNTKYFKKGEKWYKQQTRDYQQPDLGYKLNLILDKIPQFVLLPALLQPAFRLASVLLFSLTTTTYQPSTADVYLYNDGTNQNWGTVDYLKFDARIQYLTNILLYFNTTDIPDGATFTQGDLSLWCLENWYSSTQTAYRMTQINWTETGASWQTYNGTNAWTTAGGDYTTTNSCTINVSGQSLWETWSSATLIQDCYNNQSKKVSLLIRDTGSSANNGGSYASKEYTTDTALRPKLTVTYTVTPTAVPVTLALSTTLELPTTVTVHNSCALTTDLEPNKWSKEPQHTSTWVKEPTHDNLYIS